jgi:hypothetical protein
MTFRLIILPAVAVLFAIRNRSVLLHLVEKGLSS